MYPETSVNLLGSANSQRRIRHVHFLPKSLIAFSYLGHGVSQFIVLLAATPELIFVRLPNSVSESGSSLPFNFNTPVGCSPFQLIFLNLFFVRN